MFGIPEKEIKQAVTNADGAITEIRRDVVPRVVTVLALTGSILGDLKVISESLKAIFARKS